jgi:hypothetical protein
MRAHRVPQWTRVSTRGTSSFVALVAVAVALVTTQHVHTRVARRRRTGPVGGHWPYSSSSSSRNAGLDRGARREPSWPSPTSDGRRRPAAPTGGRSVADRDALVGPETAGIRAPRTGELGRSGPRVVARSVFANAGEAQRLRAILQRRRCLTQDDRLLGPGSVSPMAAPALERSR